MNITNLRTKPQRSSLKGTLVVALRPQAKEKFRMVAALLFVILQKLYDNEVTLMS